MTGKHELTEMTVPLVPSFWSGAIPYTVANANDSRPPERLLLDRGK